MICPRCELECGEDKFHPGKVACVDALKARLAQMTRDFDALHVMWKNVSGALCDAGSCVVYERDYARSVRELTAERDAMSRALDEVRNTCGVGQRDALKARLAEARAHAERLRVALDRIASSLCGSGSAGDSREFCRYVANEALAADKEPS